MAEEKQNDNQRTEPKTSCMRMSSIIAIIVALIVTLPILYVLSMPLVVYFAMMNGMDLFEAAKIQMPIYKTFQDTPFFEPYQQYFQWVFEWLYLTFGKP